MLKNSPWLLQDDVLPEPPAVHWRNLPIAAPISEPKQTPSLFGYLPLPQPSLLQQPKWFHVGKKKIGLDVLYMRGCGRRLLAKVAPDLLVIILHYKL